MSRIVAAGSFIGVLLRSTATLRAAPAQQPLRGVGDRFPALLAAEMRVPGRAWLEFEVVPVAGGAVIHQTAVFEPVGLFGLLYWYALRPVHALIFGGLLGAIARRAWLRP